MELNLPPSTTAAIPRVLGAVVGLLRSCDCGLSIRLLRYAHMTHNEVFSRANAGPVAARSSPDKRLLLDVVDTVREPLLLLDSDFRVTHANRTFFSTFRVAPEDTIGEVLFTLANGQCDITHLRALLHDRLVAEREVYDIDVDHAFPGIGRKIMQVNARLVSHGTDVSGLILLAIEDVTERRLAERLLVVQHRELERSNAALNEFAFVASHDLQEPRRPDRSSRAMHANTSTGCSTPRRACAR